MVPNRLKFLLAGPVLEAANPRLPGHPHERLAELVPAEVDRVLEVCAGTGYLARLVARTRPGADVQALDISPEMLAVGRRRAATAGLGRVAFVEADAADLPFEDASYDIVLTAFGLHELPADVRVRAVSEIARVLRPRGRLFAVDLDAPSPPSRVFATYMRWVEKPAALDVLGPGLTRLLAGAGFEIAQHVPVHVRPIPFQLVEAITPGARGAGQDRA